MSVGVLFVLIIATFFNYLIIRKNLKAKRYGNIVVDLGMIFALSVFFNGTITGMAIATSVSAMISIHLIFKPVEALTSKKHRKSITWLKIFY